MNQQTVVTWMFSTMFRRHNVPFKGKILRVMLEHKTCFLEGFSMHVFGMILVYGGKLIRMNQHTVVTWMFSNMLRGHNVPFKGKILCTNLEHKTCFLEEFSMNVFGVMLVFGGKLIRMNQQTVVTWMLSTMFRRHIVPFKGKILCPKLEHKTCCAQS